MLLVTQFDGNNPLAIDVTRAYLPLNPDIVATLEGLAPRGAGHRGTCRNRFVASVVQPETEWPIWRA